jgi:transcriptional regulator with XRE-family HTH domain
MVQRPIVQRQRIGPAIRKLRHEQDLTLDDLAEQAGISASHLSRLERGQTLPSFTVLAGIAHVLGVSIDEFARLEQDVTVLDGELADFLDDAGVDAEAKAEMLSLSIEGRRALLDLFEHLSAVPISAQNAQDQALRAVMEHGLAGASAAVSRIVSAAGMDAVAVGRALSWLLSAPGRQRVVSAVGGLVGYPSDDLAAVHRALAPDLPISPEVAAWWRGGQTPSPVTVIADRKLATNFLRRGAWVTGMAPVSPDALGQLVGATVAGIDSGMISIAFTDVELGRVNYVVSETDVLIEAPKHSGSDKSRIGLVVRGVDAAATIGMNFDSLWDQLPEADKDPEQVKAWLQSHSAVVAS